MDDIEMMTARDHLMVAAVLIADQLKVTAPAGAVMQAADTAERAIEAVLAMLTGDVLTFDEVMQ